MLEKFFECVACAECKYYCKSRFWRVNKNLGWSQGWSKSTASPEEILSFKSMAESLQLDLSPSPTDIPSSLVFHPQTPTSLLVSSWDSTLRYYTISTNPSAQLISQYNHPAPILDCNFSADGKNAITGSVNGNVNW